MARPPFVAARGPPTLGGDALIGDEETQQRPWFSSSSGIGSGWPKKPPSRLIDRLAREADAAEGKGEVFPWIRIRPAAT